MDKARVKLKTLTLEILCTCGKPFLAEDLEPECPYCGRRHKVRLTAEPALLKVEVETTENSLEKTT